MSKHVSAYLVLAAVGLVLLATPGLADTRAKTKAPTTIMLVHGAFSDASTWDRVIPLLLARGYNVVALNPPMSSLADDVEATTRAIDAQDGDVVLVGHSYAGAIITEAGNHLKVKSLVYIAAFAPDASESILDLGVGQPAPAWLRQVKVDSAGFGVLRPQAYLSDFAQDVKPAEAMLMVAKQAPANMTIYGSKVTKAAWKTRPSWYVRAENDRIIDPEVEAMMAKRMNATTTSLKACHVVMYSHAKEVSKVILDAAAGMPVASK